MGLYSRLLRRVASRRWFSATASRVAPPLDRLVRRVSGGRWRVTPSDLPTLFLSTIGRQTGRPRIAPLLYVEDGGAWIVVGTNWGKPSPPAWALNLLADPVARVSIGRDTMDVVATPIADADGSRFWPLFDGMLPAYAAYRSRLTRPVPMFRLVPVRDG